MQKLNYKKFIDLSKYVTNFSKMRAKEKLIFYVEAPFRYRKFKKTYEEEMKAKIEKKEVE